MTHPFSEGNPFAEIARVARTEQAMFQRGELPFFACKVTVMGK